MLGLLPLAATAALGTPATSAAVLETGLAATLGLKTSAALSKASRLFPRLLRLLRLHRQHLQQQRLLDLMPLTPSATTLRPLLLRHHHYHHLFRRHHNLLTQTPTPL